MPTLDQHQSSKFVKLLYIGDSGTGKTGSLVSLVKAGYKLRILDFDNGLDALVQFVGKECPDKMKNVDFITLRDLVTPTEAGPVVTAKAYVKGTKYLDKWEDGSAPKEWGEDTILVIDSGTAFGASALAFATSLQPGAKDPRQWYFAAQKSFENTIGMLTSEAFKTNVIFITHINYKELQENIHKGYPSAVGSALGPTLPKYFNTMVQATVIGMGKNVRRKISTLPTAILDLKNPKPFKIEAEYDLGIGMAELFKELKDIGKE